MPMHNLIEYSDNYSKRSGSLWQHYYYDSFNFKAKITGQTDDDGKMNAEIMVPLKYLSNFCRTLEMPLINSDVNLILTWSANCTIVCTDVANQGATFTITETKLYVPVATLSTQDNAKLLM